MRLLLLLSALLTALTGGVAGTAACAQPVQASASATQARQGPVAHVPAPLAGEAKRAVIGSESLRIATYVVVRAVRAPYGERRRE